jgi:hypothetical protein
MRYSDHNMAELLLEKLRPKGREASFAALMMLAKSRPELMANYSRMTDFLNARIAELYAKYIEMHRQYQSGHGHNERKISSINSGRNGNRGRGGGIFPL